MSADDRARFRGGTAHARRNPIVVFARSGRRGRGDVVGRAAEWMPSDLEAALGPGDASAPPWCSPAWMQEKTRRNQR